jgi:hypothetical protein
LRDPSTEQRTCLNDEIAANKKARLQFFGDRLRRPLKLPLTEKYRLAPSSPFSRTADGTVMDIASLDLDPGATCEKVLEAMRGHVLAEGETFDDGWRSVNARRPGRWVQHAGSPSDNCCWISLSVTA